MLVITETNFMQLPEPTSIPLWVTSSGLPVDYLSWEAIQDISSMVCDVDDATPISSHTRRNLGYYTKIWFDCCHLLPARVNVMLGNTRESFVRFIDEHILENCDLFCYTIKHDTAHCQYQNIKLPMEGDHIGNPKHPSS